MVRILVVTDACLLGHYLSADLNSYGTFKVIGPCTTSDEACRLAAGFSPHVALIDKTMSDHRSISEALGRITTCPLVGFMGSDLDAAGTPPVRGGLAASVPRSINSKSLVFQLLDMLSSAAGF